jgi:hypothetical protein
VVKGEELNLMRIDTDLLQYFEHHVVEAVASKAMGAGFWRSEAVLMTLGQLARCDYNKRLLLAQGIVIHAS